MLAGVLAVLLGVGAAGVFPSSTAGARAAAAGAAGLAHGAGRSGQAGAEPAGAEPAGDVGVRHTWIDASGGRSMVEEMPGQVNGYDTARTMVSDGFRGCWVIALGTNDTANVSAGSTVGRMARIQELMSVAQDGWFISDGIHYTPAGYAARAHLIARALERAFPRSGQPASCVVH